MVRAYSAIVTDPRLGLTPFRRHPSASSDFRVRTASPRAPAKTVTIAGRSRTSAYAPPFLSKTGRSSATMRRSRGRKVSRSPSIRCRTTCPIDHPPARGVHASADVQSAVIAASSRGVTSKLSTTRLCSMSIPLRATLVAGLLRCHRDVILRDERRLADVRELGAEVPDVRRDLLRLEDLGHVALRQHLVVAGAHLDLGAPQRLELRVLPGLDHLLRVESARPL